MKGANTMNEDIKKIYDFVEKEEERYYELAFNAFDKGNGLANQIHSAEAAAYQKIRYFIEMLEGDREESDGWIPVSERLPDENNWCAITYLQDYGAGILAHSTICEFEDGKWIEADGEVIAWQPLPEPYEPEPPKEESL